MIFHITTKEAWDNAREIGYYTADSLLLEGFIHTSTKEQVKATLERYYKDVPGLLLMHIDESRLMAPLKYELAASVNETFPHVYGTVNLDAVVATTMI